MIMIINAFCIQILQSFFLIIIIIIVTIVIKDHEKSSRNPDVFPGCLAHPCSVA